MTTVNLTMDLNMCVGGPLTRLISSNSHSNQYLIPLWAILYVYKYDDDMAMLSFLTFSAG